MVVGKKTFPILILIGSTAWSTVYVVRKGDVLSRIAHSKIGNPVYGKSGSLKTLLGRNTQIENPNRIYPGNKIIIGDEEKVVQSEPPQREPSSEPTPVVVLDDNFNLKIGVDTGATILAYIQSGPFGAISGSALALNTLDVHATAAYQRLELQLDLSQYAFQMPADTVNTSAQQTKSFQELSIFAGAKNLLFGFIEQTMPILKTSGLSSLEWSDFSTLAAVGRFQIQREIKSTREVRLTGEVDALYVVQGSSAAAIQAANVNGYGIRASGQIQKALNPSVEGPRYFLGLKMNAGLDHLSFDGSSGISVGHVSRDLQQYQGLITFEIEL